ncbi:MAG: N-acetylglucosamine-6-phosphate deacetylase [Chloroflexota bacterium]|nr:MAG: N-acetylglucosamine-6-phosphate deacetylase [Chloroflexota bacterium]
MAKQLKLTNVRIVAPSGIIERGWLLSRDGQIAALGAGDGPETNAEVIDGGGRMLLPGFIDIHVHGGAGHEAMDATPDALRGMARFYAQHGVTAFLATTWTDTNARINAALETIVEMQGPQEDGATLLGAHVEGPFLNPERGGAQNNNYIRRATRDEALPWLDHGIVRLLALAPEYPENHWLIEECVRRNIVVSAAHTAATYEQMRRAVDLGVTQTTHTYNAMTGLHHREPGTLGAAMSIDALTCELIADNIHVHPVAMGILAKVKGPDRIILVTDAVRGAGMADGEYQIDERTVVVRDGAVRLPDGTLAGSTLTMERALKNYIAATGLPLVEAVKASSSNAARALRIDGRKGSLLPGKDADLTLLDDDFNVCLTVAEGRIVYRNGV